MNTTTTKDKTASAPETRKRGTGDRIGVIDLTPPATGEGDAPRGQSLAENWQDTAMKLSHQVSEQTAKLQDCESQRDELLAALKLVVGAQRSGDYAKAFESVNQVYDKIVKLNLSGGDCNTGAARQELNVTNITVSPTQAAISKAEQH